jgi:regulator of nucleoside diphosphate kinase
MLAPNPGERKLTELDFTRLKRVTVAGALPQLDDSLNEAEVVPGKPVPPRVVVEGILFQPEASSDCVT